MEEKKTADYPSVFGYAQYCTPVGIAAGEESKARHNGGAKRFVGVDLSKQTCHVCIIDRQGMIVLHERYSLRSSKRGKLYEGLEEGDLVLMEASTGTFNIARTMNKLPGVVACVVNPHSTRINQTKKDRQRGLLVLGAAHIPYPGGGAAVGEHPQRPGDGEQGHGLPLSEDR